MTGQGANAAQTEQVRTAAFIRSRMPCSPVDGLAHLRLHQANAASGVARFVAASAHPSGSPYWAWCWPGGLALALHLHAHPELAAGKTVLDLGSGSGLVAIAAAKAGADAVTAVDTDPLAAVAQSLNAEANNVRIIPLCADLLEREAFAVDLVTVGDLFYEPQLAGRVMACLLRFRAMGACVLVGDPGRAFLPRGALHRLASWQVREFGVAPAAPSCMTGVFALPDVPASGLAHRPDPDKRAHIAPKQENAPACPALAHPDPTFRKTK